MHYTPTSRAGHALYTRALLTALAAAGDTSACRSACDQHVPFAPSTPGRPAYSIHCLPAAVEARREFRGKARRWSVSRLGHYISIPPSAAGLPPWFLGAARPLTIVHFHSARRGCPPWWWSNVESRSLSADAASRSCLTVHNIRQTTLFRKASTGLRIDSGRVPRGGRCDALIWHFRAGWRGPPLAGVSGAGVIRRSA